MSTIYGSVQGNEETGVYTEGEYTSAHLFETRKNSTFSYIKPGIEKCLNDAVDWIISNI